MAQCSQSAFEFIQGAYGPMIAVLCTEDAEIACQKNNLNFVELIRPFSQLTSEAHIRDPLNQTHPVKGWKLRFVELSAPNPSKDAVNQLLSDVVLRTQGSAVENSAALSIESQKKAATPWFDAFRDCFIQMVKPSDHEYIRHFVGCLFVVSSNNSDPLNAFQSLSAALDHQQPSDTIHSKWFSSNIFKYYLMIHDITDGVQTKAEGIYQSMKSFYGSSVCHMLMINSRNAEQYTPNLPDPWAQFIISTSKKTFDMTNDEAADDKRTEEEGDEIIVDENCDPLVAVQKIDNQATPILIGPLSFDNEDNSTTPEEHKGTSKTDGENRSSDRWAGGTCQFSGGLLSQTGNGGGQHGACLSLSDHDRIRIFIHELAIRGLLPFIEKAMRTLYDLIMARKGIHKSFFHATKKWFGAGKPAGQVEASHIPGIIYTSDSPELSWRKLGDLAFLVQNYDLAYNCYHTAKRDFNTNHAWLYFSGALEMASLSAFMVGNQRQYPSHYMETSISTYIDTCRQHQFATRATLFSTEAFKSKGMYSEAAFAFLKMTGEESDLLSAILLEQAAHCFLRTNPPRIRKYAFNMILAGHRYSKASQRKHALRCYKHSLINYHGRFWGMAEDHINFIIGRQSFNLRQLEDALAAFKQLLVGESTQSAEQQASYLREFLFVFQQLSKQKQPTSTESSWRLPILPLPKLLSNSARIIFTYHALTPTVNPPSTNHEKTNSEHPFVSNPFDSIKTAAKDDGQAAGLYSFDHLEGIECAKWEQIEIKTYEIVKRCQTPANLRNFVPCLTNKTNNASRPQGVINETIGVEVVLENELKIPLTLSNLSLLWTFLPEDENDEEKRVCNEFEVNDEYVRTEVVEEFSISGDEKKPARLGVTPLRTGNLRVTGIKFSLSSVTLSGPVDYIDTKSATTVHHPAISAVSLLGRLDIGICGPRLNGNKVERTSVVYGEDNRLNIMVVKPMPRLEVVFRGFPSALLSGELQAVQVSFSNQGEGPLHKLYVASTSANFFAFVGASEDCEDLAVPENQNNSQSCSLRRVSKVSLPDGLLNPGRTAALTMWVQGRGQAGPCVEELLFYYESAEPSPSMSHRAVRHQATIRTSKSLTVRATGKRSKESSTKGDDDADSEGNNQLVLAFEVENLSAPDSVFRTFSVLQVSCVSKKWIMKPLSHQKNDGAMKINQGETVMTYFKAVRRKQDSDLKISNVNFVDELIDISSPPYSEFFYRSNAWQELKQADERSDGTMGVGLGLVALWESSYIDSQLSKHSVRGQSQVAVITLAESISAPILKQPSKRHSLDATLGDISSSGNTELYIKYTVRSPGTITHDFEKERSCTIAVEVTLHNCSQYSVRAFAEMLTNSLDSFHGEDSTSRKDEKGLGKPLQPFPLVIGSNSSGVSSQYSTAFVWIGKKCSQVKLEPGQTVTLAFKANVFKTGVFNMHHCRILATLASGDMNSSLVLQKPGPPCVVVVRNAADPETDSKTRLEEDLFGLFDYKTEQR